MLCKSKMRYCLKLPHTKMLACLYCLGKGKACSLEPLPAEESCEADTDGDLEEAGAAEATVSTSAAVVVQTAEAPEVMEEVQATEAKGSIVEPSPVPEERAEGDHAEGVSRQQEQLERELREVTADYATPAAEEAVARALGEGSDVQEVPGASVPEPETVPRQG